MKKLTLLFVLFSFFSLSIYAQQVSITITVDNPTINYGESTIIHWTATNANYCITSGGTNGWSNSNVVTSGMFNTGPLYDSSTFTITAVGATGRTSESLTIIVNPYIYTDYRIAGEGTNIELPIYINGYLKKFDLDIDGYPSYEYSYIEPKYFYESSNFYYDNSWLIRSHSEGQKIKISGLGNPINLSYEKFGTLGLYIYENSNNNASSNMGVIKTNFFNGNNYTASYWNIKILKLPRWRYYDQNKDGNQNVLDAENIFDSLGVSVNDTTKVLHDLNGDGERTTSDVICYINILVDPNNCTLPIHRSYGNGAVGSIPPRIPITAIWKKLPTGKYGLFSDTKITNGDLLLKNTNSANISGGNKFKKIDKKIYFINNTSITSPILIADSPVGLTGTVNSKIPIKIESFVVGVEDNSTFLPKEFQLAQNYPNPFNPETIISFSLPSSQFVTLKVYDILGKEVANLVSEQKNAGRHEIKFNASALASGTYLYRLSAGSVVQIKKMILLK